MKLFFCREWIMVLIAFPMLISSSSWAQEIKSTTYRNHMGIGYGRGSTRGISTLATPNGYNSSEEEYYCKTKDYVYTLGFNNLGSPETSGLVFGFYLDGTIGLSYSDYYIRYSLSFDPVWAESFGVIMNLNAGLQMGYYLQDPNIVVGMRYFNNYNADELRSGYGNADDPATIGLFFTKSRLDADFSYGADWIPGILVRSPVFDIYRFNFNYTLPRRNWEDGDVLAYLGLRYEHSVLKETDTFIPLDGNDEATVNFTWITFGIRL